MGAIATNVCFVYRHATPMNTDNNRFGFPRASENSLHSPRADPPRGLKRDPSLNMRQLFNKAPLLIRPGGYLFLLLLFCLVSDISERLQNVHSSSKSISQSLLAQAQQVGLEPPRPALYMILPQSFSVPLGTKKSSNSSKLQQYVAIMNNAQNDVEDQQIRQNYKKLSLQIRDSRTPLTGQLFFESIFDYFPIKTRNHMLLPVNLEQISPIIERSSSNNDKLRLTPSATFSDKVSTKINLDPDKAELFSKQASRMRKAFEAQRLIVSIRPVGENGLGSENEELVSSAPIVVEGVSSSDGQRAFSVVQTDKPIYKPNERVRIRALVVSESLRPILEEEVRIQIKNPHKVVVEEVRFPRPTNEMQSTNNKHPIYLDHIFEFPPEPMLGTWSVHLVHNDPIANDTTSFEVREYALPSFEVLLQTPEYVLLNTNFSINVSATAKYHHGKPVQGFIQFKFSYKESLSKPRAVAQTQVKKIDPETGRMEFRINSTRFENSPGWPPQSEAQLVVEAYVTEAINGHREVAEDSSCRFIKMPYRISFEDSIDDFKPGLTQQLKVKLVHAISGKPGPAGTRIVAEYRDQNNKSLNTPSAAAENKPVENDNRLDTEAFTNSQGEAVFNVGPVKENTTFIYVSMHAPNTNDATVQVQDKKKRTVRNELASGHFSLRRHESQNGWISLMNKSTTKLRIGESFVSDILIRDAVLDPKKIFYVIVNKGHIVALSNLDVNGLVNFQITANMMPSIRLVLFALTHDSVGLLSDSMRINVDQNLNCGLKLSYKSKSAPQISTDTARPNESGSIEVSARQGDVVSLIGVDNAIYSLNNRTRLQSDRIIERVKRLDPGCGFGGGRDNIDVFHNAGLMLFKNSAGVGVQPGPVGTSCFSFAQLHKYVEDSFMGYTRPMLYNHIKSKGAEQKVRHSQFRAKRDVDVDALIDRYSDPKLKECCRLGTYEDEPQRRSCESRKSIVAKYMRDSGKCAGAYFECCNEIYGPASEIRTAGIMGMYTPIDKIARSEVHLLQSAAYPNEVSLARIESQTLVRKDFRESWLFDIVSIDEATGKASLDVQLPHSITSWSISALALNEDKPMCFMPYPLLVRGFQEVFLHVKMPYKVVQGEQIDLVVTLYNYSPEKQNVLVYMYGVDDVCSDAEPGERSQRHRISIERHSSELTIFPMIPLRAGTYPIKIVAITMHSNTSDIIERQLLVVPRGRPVTDETTFSLDPMNQQRRSKRAIQAGNLVDEIDSQRGLQRSRIRLTPSREFEHIVPQTQECIVSAVGDKMGQTVQTTILDVENLIRLPHGCGEQVMIYLGPTLYTARYLEAIGRLTGDMRWRANRYIQSGYKRVLNFRQENGGFSAFAGREPSVWLTAFIAKMLCQAERTSFVAKEIHVDKMVIRSALNWLVDRQDAKLGTWKETNPVYHREMLGGVLKEKGLTAFVSITLSECSRHAYEVVDEIELEKGDSNGQQVSSSNQHMRDQGTNGVAKIELAAKRAERALLVDSYRALKEKNAYVLSLVSYSLSLTNQTEAVPLLNSLMSLSERWQSRNHLFWRGDHQVETAAYALQALIELAPLITSPDQLRDSPTRPGLLPGLDAVAIANWLSSRRSYTGAFDSTQDTIVGLEALSKFAQLQPTPDGGGLIPQPLDSASNLHCNVTVGNRTRRSIDLGKENAQILQTFKLDPNDLNSGSEETLDIITSGNGVGSMTIKLKYNILLQEDGLCRFDIDTSIEEWRAETNMDNDAVPTSNGNPDNKNAQQDQFPRAMLSELNLPDSNRPRMGTVEQPNQSKTVLRLRRLAPLPVASALEPQPAGDSWTSKLSSSIRSFWFSPKMTTATTPRPSTSHDESTSEPTGAPDVQRRNSPHRRSTAQSPAPPSTSISSSPNNTHLNTLASRIEIFTRNQTSPSSPNYTTNIIEDPNRQLILLLRVCAHHMSTQTDELSGMAVMEVGILSGFKPNEADLKQISRDSETLVKKYEISPDRSVVIFYLDYIPSSGPVCLQFRLIQDSAVYNLQSAYIRVYDYYSQSPAQSCASFYTPTRLRELLKTNCDSSNQVCQCVFASMCPPSRKLTELASIHGSNVTSAQEQLINLVCKDKYDLVSLVKVKKTFPKNEVTRELKLWVKIDSDLRGNLSQIIELQRLQKSQLQARRPAIASSGEELSLDYLQLTLNDTCLQGGDPLLMHLDQETSFEQRQAGEQMLLFARSSRLERRPFRIGQKGPTPRANIFTSNQDMRHPDEPELGFAPFEDVHNHQYSLTLPLDREALLQDVSYRAKSKDREAINSLIRWLENQKRLKDWACAGL